MNIHSSATLGKSFLRPAQLSSILGTCGYTIRKAIKRGEIPAKKIGRFYYVPISFLESIQNAEQGKESHVPPV